MRLHAEQRTANDPSWPCLLCPFFIKHRRTIPLFNRPKQAAMRRLQFLAISNPQMLCWASERQKLGNNDLLLLACSHWTKEPDLLFNFSSTGSVCVHVLTSRPSTGYHGILNPGSLGRFAHGYLSVRVSILVGVVTETWVGWEMLQVLLSLARCV